jgi:hypothetical protein
MEPSGFDELAFFRALSESGVRALLIGRRALVLLGLPVLTADYDFWIDIDDIAVFNEIGARFDLRPTRSPDEARRSGRYVLENDEHIDVVVARSIPTSTGVTLDFEDLWVRILTKQIASRPRDLEDIRLLRLLKERDS